jgi:hypothetical protein
LRGSGFNPHQNKERKRTEIREGGREGWRKRKKMIYAIYCNVLKVIVLMFIL